MAERSPTCPECGHDLSRFEEKPASRSERLAAAVADRVATWWFVGAIGVFVVAWVAVNMIWRPFEPYPLVTLAVLSSVLACVAALQGPLILVSQRRAADRDRMRDREALRVAANTETDIHAISEKLDRLVALIQRDEAR